jgi:large subunit ribosomal protein L25
MQENFEISATPRDVQGKGASRRLRREGLVPGIIYGGGKEPQMFAAKHNELIQHLDREAFYSHILTVDVGGKKQKVVLKDLQRHPAKPFIMHMDLLRVSDSDRIKMHVPLHFVNEDTAPGIKAGGKASHSLTDIEIICAAKDLPEFIEVDMAEMEMDAAIRLSELKLPEGVEIVALAHGEDYDTGVVAIHAPKAAVEEVDEAEAPAQEEGDTKE